MAWTEGATVASSWDTQIALTKGSAIADIAIADIAVADVVSSSNVYTWSIDAPVSANWS